MPAVLLPVLICLALTACTTEQVTGSAFVSAKTACRLNPAQCTIHSDAQ
jgi:hypothetical protein